MEKQDAEQYLRIAVGDPDARFRPGQWEAIDNLVNAKRKLLVVERTGWGKSSVYFISTRILRDRGAGPTIIISPLLALMRNQIEAAGRLGVRAASVNSSNKQEWARVQRDVLDGKVDAILISPERLANERFIDDVLLPVASRIGLFVVDEAHCISDWGHDFRPDYRRLVNVLRQMPANLPLLGTTATANNRVVEDIESQLGSVKVQRGPLVRKSLILETLVLPDQPSRLAWLAEHVPTLPGSGIVYVLTQRDAEQVAQWLRRNGVKAFAYHSDSRHARFPDSDSYRRRLEDALLGNEVKALVATTALGMGYDKPDLGFVVHYQAPGSVVAYYQQVGRAGRAIERAYGILLSGEEDARIHEFFRRSSFPDEEVVRAILNLLARADALSVAEIERSLNLSRGIIGKTLKLLSVESPAPVIQDGSRWRRTPVAYEMDHERIRHLTMLREQEWDQVERYMQSQDCLMMYLSEALDDPTGQPCGSCAVCRGAPLFGVQLDRTRVLEAQRFLRQSEVVIEPRRKVPAGAFVVYGFTGNLPANLLAEPGRYLARWGDAGWGALVRDGKHAGRFSDELVEAVVDMLANRWKPHPEPSWVTCIPSLRHPELVPDYARRLAARLGRPFVEVIQKTRLTEPQKLQQNSFHQCGNLDGVFSVAGAPPGAVLLVDDVVDSRWTTTVAAALLRRAGSGPVYPLALASTSTGD